jgi:hypothetical protein
MSDNAATLTLDIERTGTTVVVRCHGRLVASSDDVLYAKVKQLLPDAKRIVLDLTDLTRMTAWGWARWCGCTSLPARQVAAWS